MMSPLLVQDQGTGQSVCPAEFEEFAGEVTCGRQGQGEENRAPPPVELATIMTETWITDLTHVLTPQRRSPHRSARPGDSPSG